MYQPIHINRTIHSYALNIKNNNIDIYYYTEKCSVRRTEIQKLQLTTVLTGVQIQNSI